MDLFPLFLVFMAFSIFTFVLRFNSYLLVLSAFSGFFAFFVATPLSIKPQIVGVCCLVLAVTAYCQAFFLIEREALARQRQE